MIVRALRHRAAIFVLLLLLAVHTSYVLSRNDVAPLVARSTIPAGRTWTIVLDVNGEVLHRGFDEPADDAWDHIVIEIGVVSGRWTSGWWAATRKNTEYRVIVRPFPFDWWEEEIMLHEAGLLLEEWDEEWKAEELLAARPFGRKTLSSVVWSGYMHDAIALALTVLLAMACVLRVQNDVREGAMRRRLGRGHCPTCDYDLRGCSGHSCPECGWRATHEPEG